MGVWWHALAFVTHERAKMSHKPGRNVTQAGPKCHTRTKMSHSHVIILHSELYVLNQLEQLKRLRSDDYPYHWVILDPKSKEDKVKVTHLKKSPKFQNFEFWNGHYTRHTFWSCLIRCANMKWIRWVFLKIQSGHDSVHRRTDGLTDRRTRWYQYTPLSTSLKRGYNYDSAVCYMTWHALFHTCSNSINPLYDNFFKGNINMYLQLISFFHNFMTKVAEIVPHVRPGPA